LTRENPDLEVLQPAQLVEKLKNREVAEVVELNDELAESIRKYLDEGYLVVLMTAGPADKWLREKFAK